MTEQEHLVKIQELELKVQALLEKISKITANYENTEADYRVQITLLANQLEVQNAKSSEGTPSDGPSDEYK